MSSLSDTNLLGISPSSPNGPVRAYPAPQAQAQPTQTAPAVVSYAGSDNGPVMALFVIAGMLLGIRIVHERGGRLD